MGLFGSSGDTGGSSGGEFASKLRTPSYSEDLTSDPAASSFGGGAASSLDLAGGDLQKGLQIEQQKAELMSQVITQSFLFFKVVNNLFLSGLLQIHNLNDICWDTCVGTSSLGSSLGSRTESCLSNCAGRFVDTALFITNRFAQLASKGQH